MTTHARLQQANEAIIHERVVIRDVETNDPFAVEVAAKMLLNLVSVTPLHDDNNVGPSHQLSGKRVFGVVVCPC